MSLRLKYSDIINSLPEEDLNKLLKNADYRYFAKNEILFREGDSCDKFYLIIDGRIKIFCSSGTGKEFTLRYLHKHDYFGEIAILQGQTRIASARALESTKLLVLTKEDFETILLANPFIVKSLAKDLAVKVIRLTEIAKSLALGDSYKKIICVVNSYAKSEHNHTLTQQELGNICGTSREMVARVLKDLEKGGYIAINKKKISVLKILPEKY